MFGFTVEDASEEIVLHGFRVTYPDQAERDAAMKALVAEMMARGPQRMTISD